MSKDRAAQLVEAGIWLKLSGDREGARKLFERALKLDPGNEKAEQLLAGAPAPGETTEVAPPPAAPVPPPPTVAASAAGTNPFERPEHSAPAPAETDWGMATGFKTNPTPEPSLDGDWGRLTGASTPVPQPMPPGAAPGDPGPYTSTSSSVVLGAPPPPALGAPPPPAPRATMQLFTPSVMPANAPAPRTTMQLFTPSATDPQAPAPRTTMQLFNPAPGSGESAPRQTLQLFTPPSDAPATPAPRDTMQRFGPPSAPQTIEIGGAAGPEVPPPSTPPLFGYGEAEPPPQGMTVTLGGSAAAVPLPPAPLFPSQNPAGSVSVTIGGEAGPDTPPPSTPPLFSAPAPAEVPAPPRTATDPMGYAWAWSSTSPPPRAVDAELPPEPRPSPVAGSAAPSRRGITAATPASSSRRWWGSDRALDLISSDSKVTRSPESQKEEIRAILRGARDLLDLDDHSGAMELIVKAQTMSPDDPDVLAMRERSEKTLLNMFESKLGKMETIPRVLLKDDEIIWLNLDHRAGFVLAQIDGTVSFDDLFSVSGMSRIDTARILAQLVEEGVISRG